MTFPKAFTVEPRETEITAVCTQSPVKTRSCFSLPPPPLPGPDRSFSRFLTRLKRQKCSGSPAFAEKSAVQTRPSIAKSISLQTNLRYSSTSKFKMRRYRAWEDEPHGHEDDFQGNGARVGRKAALQIAALEARVGRMEARLRRLECQVLCLGRGVLGVTFILMLLLVMKIISGLGVVKSEWLYTAALMN